MKAIVYHEYGSPAVLKMGEVETPVPGSGEVLVKIHAASVNFGDLMARNFNRVTAAEFSMPFPFWLLSRFAFGFDKPKNPILGSEFAGQVAAVGAGVTRFKPGDAVFGYRGMQMGCYAEYCLMPENGMLAPKPQHIDYAEAATIPYGALTAMNLLKQVNLAPGAKVLVNGASGGIGSFALQLAKIAGAEVTGVCGTPRLDMVRALGADRVMDYSREDFTRGGQTYDVILDVLGKRSFGEVRNSLKPHGVLLLASFKMLPLLQMLLTKIIGGRQVICALSNENAADLEDIRRLVEEDKLKTIVDRRFPLEEAAEAHRYAESGGKTGKVVITMENEA